MRRSRERSAPSASPFWWKHDKGVGIKTIRKRRRVTIMPQSDDVKTEVLNALYWDLAVPRHRVKVEVEDGWVTISGMVDWSYQLTCAESDARRVSGVVGVSNRIRLAPTNSPILAL
jgi:osmotically-inducible protein OsmY